MSACGQLNVDKMVDWLFNCSDKGGKVDFTDLKNLVEIFGFSASLDSKSLDPLFPQQANQVDVTNDKPQFLTVFKVKKDEEDIVATDKTSNIMEIIKVILRSSSDVRKILSNYKNEATSPCKLFSPRSDKDFHFPTANLVTSSPVGQNKLADKLSRIMLLVKEAQELSAANEPQLHKMQRRMSDIKISPLAFTEMENKSNHELNVTKNLEGPSILRRTPTRGKKEPETLERITPNRLTPNQKPGVKKSFFQPLVSRLRTPTTIKSQLKQSPSIQKSSSNSLRVPSTKTDRRQSIQNTRENTPASANRIPKYSAVLKK